MNKTMLRTALLSVVLLSGMPHAAAMLGVSSYAATKVVDGIMVGLSFWALFGLVATGVGAFAAVWYLVKGLIKRVGRSAAIAW